MRVLKFGGSSLATSDRIRGVVRIVLDEARKERPGLFEVVAPV